MLLRTREPALGLWTGIETREIARTSRLVSRPDRLSRAAEQGDRRPQRLRARGRHPPGRRPEGAPRPTRSWMPRASAWRSNSIVLGKHSGRHALSKALEEMGFDARRPGAEHRLQALQGDRRPQAARHGDGPRGARHRRAAPGDQRLHARVVRRRVLDAAPTAREGHRRAARRGSRRGLVQRRRPDRRRDARDRRRDRAAPEADRVHDRRRHRRPGRARRGLGRRRGRRLRRAPGRASRPTSSMPPRAPTCARSRSRWRGRSARARSSPSPSARRKRSRGHSRAVATGPAVAADATSCGRVITLRARCADRRTRPYDGARRRRATSARRVRALRDAAGYSLRDLAERSGVSAPMLSQVERGETSPTLTVAAQDRRRPGPAPLPAAAPGRGRRGHDRARARTRASGGSARRGHTLRGADRRRCPGSAPSSPATRSPPGAATGAADDPPMHEPGSRETALVERGRVVLRCDGERLRARARATASPSTPTCRTDSRTPADREATFLAVCSAGLRRS